MPNWYFLIMTFAVAAAVLGFSVRHMLIQTKHKRDIPLILNWEDPEGALAFLFACGYFGLVPPDRWISGLGLLAVVFYVIRGFRRGNKANALPIYPTHMKETSWNS